MTPFTKRESGKWQATVRKDGKSRSRSFSKQADASKWARETELKAERGEWQKPFDFAAAPMTLGQVLERYRDEVTSLKQCADNERYAINACLRLRIASVSLGKLTSTQLARHRDHRLETLKPASVVRELGWMQHAIDIACTNWGQHLPNGNPVRQVRRPKINNRRERRLQAGEWQALLDAVSEQRTPILKALLRLALATGMRRGELLGMQWRHVDLERRTVFLPKTKNGNARTVPLSPDAVRVLEAVPRDGERCFPLTGNAVRLAFERIRRRAGVQDITFHDIRHEAISRFVERGLSLAQVQMISGHRDLRMLLRYTHLAVDDIVNALHDAA